MARREVARSGRGLVNDAMDHAYVVRMAGERRRGGHQRLALSLRQVGERITQSLFFLPATCLLGGAVLARLMVALDGRLSTADLPEFLVSTVDSARAVLSVVAGGTITLMAIVVSLTLVAVQIASAQFTPRALRSFLGDRFQQLTIGLLAGTVTYALVVLSEVQRAPGTGRAEAPNLSVSLAVFLAAMSLLVALGSIDHTARSLRVGTMADRIVAETNAVIERQFGSATDKPVAELALEAPEVTPARPRAQEPPADALVIGAHRTGWVQQLTGEALLDVAPARSTVRVEVAIGGYVFAGSPILTVWPVESSATQEDSRVLSSVVIIGDERTMQQDVGYGLVRLADIAIKALSPGVNDPNTANEIVVRLGGVVTELLTRRLEPSRLEADGRTILRTRELEHRDYVDVAFNQVRRAASNDPDVSATLLRTLGTIRSEVARRCPEHHAHADDALEDQAGLVLSGFDPDQRLQPHDHDELREAAREAGFG